MRTIFTFSLLAASAPALAQGNSGPNICDDLSGNAYGLCNAYCEAMDCDEQESLSNACAQVASNFANATGGMTLPCEDECYVPSSQVQSYDVTVHLTADDRWTGYLDGVSLVGDAVNENSWSRGDTLTYTVESGCHTLATHAVDTARVISGFIATVSVGGTVEYATGDGSWVVSPTNPGAANWMDVGYDDSSWLTPDVCANTSPWGTYWPAPFYAEGAQWIWDDANCRVLGDAYFRLDFFLP